MLVLILFPVFVLSAVLLAFAGQDRKIGFWWTLFFCLTLTPAAAWCLLLLSRQQRSRQSSSGFTRHLAILFSFPCMAVGMVIILLTATRLLLPVSCMPGIGCIGLGIYGWQKIRRPPPKEDWW